jgi:hypothetical protein
MSQLVNLLKALGIALGAYLLLVAGVLVALYAAQWLSGYGSHSHIRLDDFGMRDLHGSYPEPETDVVSVAVTAFPLVFFCLFFLPAFGALHLPPKGRRYAATGALSLIAGIVLWVGVAAYRAMGS